MTKPSMDTIYEILNFTLYYADYDKGLALCKQHVTSNDISNRKIALEGIGHLSRIFRKMDIAFALPVLQAALDEPDTDISGTAENSIGEMAMFIPDFFPHEFGLLQDRPLLMLLEELNRLDRENTQ